ncbi:Cna B-type domain-containing protein [Enterococcus hirae]|nr:Cna B-type domain-containing protein [Enterococcus hirae]
MEKGKKAFTLLFVMVLMLANLPALVSALEQTQDISDAVSAKAELQAQKDGNWTALADQEAVASEAALKLKIDYAVSADQLEKALAQASQLEATIALPSGVDFVTQQTENHGNVTALDKKNVIGTYQVGTGSSGAQVLKLALNGEEIQKAGISGLNASVTLNATLKDPQEKQTLNFPAEKTLFTNTKRTDIELRVPSAKEAAIPAVPASSADAPAPQENAPAAPGVNAAAISDVMTIAGTSLYRIDGQGGEVPINSNTTLNVGDNVQVELRYYISAAQVGNIKNGTTVDIPMDVGESFTYPKGVDNLTATDPETGTKVVIGTYQVVKVSGQAYQYAIRVTYNDFIEKHTEYGGFGSETNPGNMDVNFQVVKVHDGTQKITINGQDVINSNVLPADRNGTDGRLGPLNKYGERTGQTNTINWKLNINYSGLVQEAQTGETAKTAYNKYSKEQEDAQFKDSLTIDVLPVGIHFDVAGVSTPGDRSLNAYMPIFFYNNTNGYIYDGPLSEVVVDMTYMPLSATSLEAAKDEVAGLAVGNYGLYTATAKETATLFGETITVEKGQEVLLMNTGDIGYGAGQVPDLASSTGYRDPKTISLMDYEQGLSDPAKTVEERKAIWDKKVQTAIDDENAKSEEDRINFNETKTKEGTDHLWSANQPYFNGGYHFDIRTTADDTFDKTAQSEIRNDVIIGYNNKAAKNATYDVDWRKGSSDIDGNLAAGTILIQKKAMSTSGSDNDSADLNGIEFQITNTDTGKTYTETTAAFTNSAGVEKDGIAKFADLPSGHYTIKEYNDRQDVTKNIYVWSVSENKYRQVDQEDPAKDLSFIVDRNTDSRGFAFALYNPRDSVTVDKKWEDQDNPKRPTNVKVDLIANYQYGKEVIDSQTLSAANNWTHTWYHLLAVGTASWNGNLVSYTVQENPIPDGYHPTVSDVQKTLTTVKVVDENGKEADATISTNYQYTITNGLKQNTTALNVQKKWEDNDDLDGKRPGSITVYLLADGKRVQDKNGNDVTIVLSQKNDWRGTFSGLAAGDTKYTVSENNWANYRTTYTPSADGSLITISNEYIPSITNVAGQKTWPNSNDKLTLDQVTIKLLADGVDTGKSYRLNKNNQWKYNFTGLQRYATDGHAIQYTVTENEANTGGFITTYSKPVMVFSLAVGTTDYTGYSIQFYVYKSGGGYVPTEKIPLTKSEDGKNWIAKAKNSDAAGNRDCFAKLVDPQGNVGGRVTLGTNIDISNTYKMPLPATGGSGTQKIILIGLSALVVSGLYIFWRKRHQKGAA